MARVQTATWGTTMSLTVSSPYAFERSVGYYRALTPLGDDVVSLAGSITRAFPLGSTIALTRIDFRGTTMVPELLCRLIAERPLTDGEVDAVACQVTRMLACEEDLNDFYMQAFADPHFAPIAARLHGTHMVRIGLTEALAWVMLAGNASAPDARRMYWQLIDAFGAAIAVDGVVFGSFPTASTLDEVGIDALTSVLGDRGVADRLRHGMHVAADAGHGTAVPLSNTAVEAALDDLNLSSSDRWFIAQRSLGSTGKLPPMGCLPSALRDIYPAGTDIARVAQRFGDWAGYWAYYAKADSVKWRSTNGAYLGAGGEP
jgi:DNA-3-methyladenine glycosylase II